MTDGQESDQATPSGPEITLCRDENGEFEEVVLGETTIIEDITPGEDINLTQAIYDAGFELTTRDLESFLVETEREIDQDHPLKQTHQNNPTTES